MTMNTQPVNDDFLAMVASRLGNAHVVIHVTRDGVLVQPREDLGPRTP